MRNSFVVAFRDRGTDPLRKANLDYVLDYVASLNLGPIHLVDDGRTGSEQFNRHKAYNTGARLAFADADVVTFYESDMIVSRDQLVQAINLATQTPGLVVPFNQYRGLSEADSEQVRAGADPHQFHPELEIPNPRRSWLRTGPLNVISKETLNRVGQWDESFAGSNWDDRAMNRAFEVCCQPTRHINGPAHHLWHLPAHTGAHLTAEDRAAKRANHRRFLRYQRARTPGQIRELTTGR